MRHRSWCAEHAGHDSNERLEFLGDAVLGLIVADHVFGTYPEHDEGWLSRARSSVVRASALADMATGLQLGEALELGKGEDASGGREKLSILADALEAVIGAVYLDAGWASAQAFVMRLVGQRIAALPGGRGDEDDKSRLQEFATRRMHQPPNYVVVEDGPEHQKTFEARVLLAGRPWGKGGGRSKKQAEQEAARTALAALHLAFGSDEHPDGRTVTIVAPTADITSAPVAPMPSPTRAKEATDA